MAGTIVNYGTLKTAAADWSVRSGFTAFMPDFVTAAETIFNYGEGEPGDAGYIKPLRCPDMEVLGTALTVDTSFQADLPSDFLAVKRVQSTSPVQTMKYADPTWFSEQYPSGDPGDFVFYTILGNKLIAGQDVTLDYLQAIPTITGSDAGTNWLLTKSPNAYLFGTLYLLSIFNKNNDKAATFRGLMSGALGAVRGVSAFQRVSAPTMRASMLAR
jgi:hypothetical protein